MKYYKLIIRWRNETMLMAVECITPIQITSEKVREEVCKQNQDSSIAPPEIAFVKNPLSYSEYSVSTLHKISIKDHLSA